MAERRMFTKKVTDDDNFAALSASAQALYLHLSMAADDDGFCNQVSASMFKAHASVQDLQALLERRYIYQFENGVIVIKHWRMANALRKDRYTPTAFQEELAMLHLKDNGSYTMVAARLPSGCRPVAACLPQDSIDKGRVVEGSIEQDNNNSFSLSKKEKEEKKENDLSAVMSFFLDNIEPQPYAGHIDFVKASIETKGPERVLDALKKCVETGKTSFPWIMKAVNEA